MSQRRGIEYLENRFLPLRFDAKLFMRKARADLGIPSVRHKAIQSATTKSRSQKNGD